MKRNIVLFMMLFIAVSISACTSYDPKAEADAYATRSQSDQRAANNEQQRQFNNDNHANDMKFKEIALNIANQLQQQWVFAKRAMIYSLGISGSCAIFIAMLSLGVGVAIYSIRNGAAKARAAEVKANLIYADPQTGLFPILITHVHGSKYAAYLPNVQGVLMLDEKNEADRQMIATMGVTQTTAVLANAAKNAKEPDAIAMIQAPIVYARDDSIEIGAEIMERLPKMEPRGAMEIIEKGGRDVLE